MLAVVTLHVADHALSERREQRSVACNMHVRIYIVAIIIVYKTQYIGYVAKLFS